MTFEILGAKPVSNAAAPALAFRLRLHDARAIHAILLNCQLRIEPRRRPHSSEEQARLTDVFGTPDRWSESVRPLAWTQATVSVPPFEGGVEIDIPAACTYDFEVTSAKYLTALEGGEIPLRFLFSGTVFVKSPNGFLVEPVPWSKDAAYRLPLGVWRELMDTYFPGAAWIRLRRDTLERLQRRRAQHGWTSWDETILELLEKGDSTCAPLAGLLH
jgi:hypothetical protein